MNVNSFCRHGFLFSLLQMGTSLSMISGHVFSLALAWWCLRETQSVTSFSSLIAIAAAAEIYLKPFLASFGDQGHRVKFILLCQLTVLGLVFIFCMARTAGVFNLVAIALGLILMSAIVSVREPTVMGLIPDLISEGEVTNALSSRAAINSVIMLLGPMLAASIITLSSTETALYISAGAMLMSCLTFTILTVKSPRTLAVHTLQGTWFRNTKGAFRAIYRVKAEFHIALISAAINFTMFPFFSVTVPYWISTQLKLAAVYLGAFEFSFALGLIAGSLYLNNLARAWLGRLNNVLMGFLILGSSVIAIITVNNIYLSIFFAFFCGTAFIFINVNLTTLRSAATPPHYRTRMSAMAMFLSSLANPFGVALAGGFISGMGVEPFAIASGLMVILISPIILCSCDLKKALSLNETEMKGYYEKTYPDAFYVRG